jgi:NADH dehydrogenase [ubiquinone] 1 alpha subcomplex assembly factor 6
MSDGENRNYCLVRVRAYDYDRYFAAVFAPPEIRRALIALYAFNLEIASVRERVSEPVIGLIRLQWWRDAVGEIYAGTVRSHAVAEELAAAIRAYNLPRERFDRMIDAREFDLDGNPPEDMAALRTYADATSGELAALAMTVCGAAERADDVGPAARAWAVAGLLRAVPFHASMGKVFLPSDALRRAGVRPEQVVDRRAPEGLNTAIAGVAEEAWALIAGERKRLSSLPRAARPAASYLPLAERYLGRILAGGGDVFGMPAELPLLGRQFRIARAGLAGRF